MSLSTTASVTPFTIYTESMTAVFTPPPSCSSLYTYEPASVNSVPGGILIQNQIYEKQNTDCYPSGYDQWGRAPSFAQVFSPGACPSGYATVGSYEGQNGAVTTAICCPSDFGYTTTISSVNGGKKTANYWGCTSQYPIDATPTTVFAFKDGFTSSYNGSMTGFTAITGPVLMWAQVVSVAFRSEDLTLFSSSTGMTAAAASTITSPPTIIPASTTTPASNTQSSTAPQTQSAPPEPQPASPAMSGGTIAGIVIGAVAVLGLLAGLAVFVWYKKRGNTSNPNNDSSEMLHAAPRHHQHHDTPSTMAAYEMAYAHEKSAPRQNFYQFGELDAQDDRRYELSNMRD